MKHHRRKGNAQTDRGLLTVQDTGVTVPAFFRILDLRDFPPACGPKDVRRANICTNPTGVTFLLVDKRWHTDSFLNEHSRDALSPEHDATFIRASSREARERALERS